MSRDQPVWLQALRWLGVLPAAVAGSLVAFWITGILVWLNSPVDPNERSVLQVVFGEVLPHGVMGVAFVGVGASLAPNGRRIVAVALCLVMLAMYGALLAAGVAMETLSVTAVISTLAVCAGSIAMTVVAFREEFYAR